MIVSLPSSSVAAIGRQQLLLRIAQTSTCRSCLEIQHQRGQSHAVYQQLRFSSNKLRPAQAAKSVPLALPQHRRVPPSQTHVSTAAATRGPAEASSNPYDFTDKINPPSTTLPAPLDVPDRQPGQGALKYYISVGKAYWAFYKAGIKNVWRNAQERRRLVRRRRTHKKTPPPAMPETKQNAVLDERALGLYATYPFTRAEFQFFNRSWRDAKRIPIFVVLLGIFGEYLPLVVMVCTPLVPYTCRIPRQIRKAREKLEVRRSKSFRGDMGAVPGPLKKGTNEKAHSIKDLDSIQVRHIARSLGLYFTFWERFGTAWPPSFVLRHRVKKRLQYIEIDDALFLRDGGVRLLKGDHEVRIAAEERGIDILNRTTDEIHGILEAWERGAEQGKTVNMLLSRPSVWAPTSSR